MKMDGYIGIRIYIASNIITLQSKATHSKSNNSSRLFVVIQINSFKSR